MKIDVWFAIEDYDTGGTDYSMGELIEFDDTSILDFFGKFSIGLNSYTFHISNNRGNNNPVFEDIAHEKGLFLIKLFPQTDDLNSISFDAELLDFEKTGETDLSVTVKLWAGSLHRIYDEPSDYDSL
jgi:hypothetical protein